ARAAALAGQVEVRVAAVLGYEPQRTLVRHPAEFVEVPVDPGRIGQPVARAYRRLCRVDRDQPAVLVVDRMQHHRRRMAVVAPLDGVLEPQRTQTLERVELRRLA